MAAGAWFWVIYVFFLVLGLACYWPWGEPAARTWRPLGGYLVIIILIGLLGWGVYGPPIR